MICTIPTARIALLSLMLLAAVGCSLSKPYPDKSLHAISVHDSPAKVKLPTKAVLRIEAVHVAKPFDDSTFVYKVGQSEFRSDYYAGFITTPEALLGAELTSFLSRSGLYTSVVEGSSIADARWMLESNVTALYGDYSGSKPAAVMTIGFFLLDSHQSIRFQHVYSETEPLADKNPPELIEGWNKAYGRILQALLKDLAEVQKADVAANDARATP